MSQSILLIGNTGQLGQELQQTLTPDWDIIAVGRSSLDLTQPEAISQIVAEVQPQIIINAAAYTAVDKAESEPELANAINAIAPGILAEETQKLGAFLIHISTDYVFDGRQSHPYQENDQTNPLGIYGKSKLRGEQAIQEMCDRYLILRTAWVHGIYGKGNFVKTMLRLGADREEIRVVGDQIGSPTWTGDLANAISQLLPLISTDVVYNVSTSEHCGIYHYTNSGVGSWYDFAVAIYEEAQQLGFPLKVQRVISITTADYPTPAQRPAYSVLACEKISKVLGTSRPHWRQGLRQMLAKLYACTYESTNSLRR